MEFQSKENLFDFHKKEEDYFEINLPKTTVELETICKKESKDAHKYMNSIILKATIGIFISIPALLLFNSATNVLLVGFTFSLFLASAFTFIIFSLCKFTAKEKMEFDEEILGFQEYEECKALSACGGMESVQKYIKKVDKMNRYLTKGEYKLIKQKWRKLISNKEKLIF